MNSTSLGGQILKIFLLDLLVQFEIDVCYSTYDIFF